MTYFFFSITNIIRDILFAYFYMKPLEKRKKIPFGEIIGICFLLSMLLMYNGALQIGIFSNSFIRLIYRGLCITGYLYFSKGLSFKFSFYFGYLINVIIIISHNLFLTPLLHPIFSRELIILNNPTYDPLICVFILNAITILFYIIIYFKLPLNFIHSVNKVRLSFLGVMIIASLYLNTSLRSLVDANSTESFEFSIYSIILQIAMIFSIILMENLQIQYEEKMAADMKIASANALINSIHRQQENDEKIRRIRHDMKNHMFSLKVLMKDQPEKAIEYVDRLSGEYTDSSIRIHTNHQLLDGLFTQKLFQAEKENIEINLSVNFETLKCIHDIDLCIIFGNVLDNALEACRKVKQDAYISIKSMVNENHLVVKVVNSHNDSKIQQSLLSTSKKDKLEHGIGLKSIKNSLDKYHGTYITSYDEKKFAIIITFPIK